MSTTLVTAIRLEQLPLIASGKVRELYKIDDSTLLMVVTDRISAYDAVLSNGIPDKGVILCQISAYWFDLLRTKIQGLRHHVLSKNPPSDPGLVSASEKALIRGRCMQVRALKVLPIEVIVRGYITGSAWEEYQKHSTVHGIPQPAGLQHCQEFPDGPIYTPSTKAPAGSKDENISPAEARKIVGNKWASQIETLALDIYKAAHAIAKEKGIIIADTKMEFGIDEEKDELVLVDELLTPDSSRFWKTPVLLGQDQSSFDKQHVRDYLKAHGLKGKPEVVLPDNVVAETTKRYREVFEQLTGRSLEQELAALAV